MRIEIEDDDGPGFVERGENGRRAIDVGIGACGGPGHRVHVGRYCIDENHAQALVLALQACIAEIQARAVSR